MVPFYEQNLSKPILQRHNGVCEETFDVNSKIAQLKRNLLNFIVRKSNLQEMANFGDYPGDFQTLIWRPVQNLESPGLSGRVDSPVNYTKVGGCYSGCVRLGHLDLDFKIRICNRTRNPKTDFNAEISVFTVKKDLKNCP